MAAITICSDFGTQEKIKSLTVSNVSPLICHEMMQPDATILVSWMLSFNPVLSLSSRGYLVPWPLSAIRMVTFAYLWLLIFFPAILIPACVSSSLAFHMMYSAYKLIKQNDNLQVCCTLFPIWNQSILPCPVLIVASWPAYRFLIWQVRWSDIPISLRIFQFVVIHTVKVFGVISKYDQKTSNKMALNICTYQ